MPVVHKDRMGIYVHGKHWEHLPPITISINGKGEYSGKLPESVKKFHNHPGTIKGMGMWGVHGEISRLINEYRKWAEAQPDDTEDKE